MARLCAELLTRLNPSKTPRGGHYYHHHLQMRKLGDWALANVKVPVTDGRRLKPRSLGSRVQVLTHPLDQSISVVLNVVLINSSKKWDKKTNPWLRSESVD